MSAGVVMAELMRAGILHAATPMADASYDFPKSGWVVGEYYKWFRQVLSALQSSAYVNEAWDCDNYADAFKLFADVAHNRMKRATGIAVGVLFYQKEGAGGHAINVVITSDRGLLFVEPQSGEFVTLTEKERKSVCLVRF